MSARAWGQVVAPCGCDLEPTAVAPKPATGRDEHQHPMPEGCSMNTLHSCLSSLQPQQRHPTLPRAR